MVSTSALVTPFDEAGRVDVACLERLAAESLDAGAAGIVALGIVAIPLPGPGWLIVIAGLFVLATEFLWAERLLEFTKKHVTRWTDWVSDQPVWVRVLIAVATAAFVYGVLVVTLHVTGVPDWVPGWVPLWQ